MGGPLTLLTSAVFFFINSKWMTADAAIHRANRVGSKASNSFATEPLMKNLYL